MEKNRKRIIKSLNKSEILKVRSPKLSRTDRSICNETSIHELTKYELMNKSLIQMQLQDTATF